MYGFSVLFHGVTGSFREPSSHLYQSTLPLPPVSALVGIAGAASGKSFEDAWTNFMDTGLFVGASGNIQGRGIDLWNYHKVANIKEDNEKKLAKELGWSKIVRRDILNREFLAYPYITAFYAFKDKEHAVNLRAAFLDPVYALSLGNSDDIACIKNVSNVSELAEEQDVSSFKDTFMLGDHADEVCVNWEKLKKASVAQTIRAPLVRKLIVDFEFKKSERHGNRFHPFTFLSGEQYLSHPQRAFRFEEKGVFIPLYGLMEDL